MPRRKGSSIPPKPGQLAALKAHHWPKGGPSPNPGGRPKAHREAVAKVRAEMDMITDGMLAIARRHANGEDLTHSDKIASNHYEFLCQFAYGRHAQSMALVGGLDVGDDPSQPGTGSNTLSALLRSAQPPDGQRLDALPPPAAEAAPDPRLTEEERAIHPASVLLAKVRADKEDGSTATPRDVLTELLGPDRVNELLGENMASAADAAPPPPRPRQAGASPASAADHQTAAAPAAAAEAPPEQPAPPPEPERAGSFSTPKPERERPKYSGIPADAVEHMAARDRAREGAREGSQDDWLKRRQEEARLDPIRYPGGQIPMNEFKPDPPERSIQGPLEVVSLSRNDPRIKRTRI